MNSDLQRLTRAWDNLTPWQQRKLFIKALAFYWLDRLAYIFRAC